ncbi:unnamed protein product [Caretta caretta]
MHGEGVNLARLLKNLSDHRSLSGEPQYSILKEKSKVIKLACTDTHVIKQKMVFNSGVLLLTVFIILLISYIIILVQIRLHVTDGKCKCLSTCGTQITVVYLMFIPTIFIYAQPFKKFALDKVVSVIDTVITPVLNSMIHTLRNAEMKKAIKKLMSRFLFSCRKLKT